MTSRVSKIVFNDMKSKLEGKLTDLDNHNEELEDRLKIVERNMKNNLKEASSPLLKFPDKNKSRSSIIIPQIPDLGKVYQRLDSVEQYSNTMKMNIKRMEENIKMNHGNLKLEKADQIKVSMMNKELRDLKQLVESYTRNQDNNNDDFGSRLNSIETEKVPPLEDKTSFHSEITRLNTDRIEKCEKDIVKLQKALANFKNIDIDMTLFEKIDKALAKLGSRISGLQNNTASALKEIREVLFTKADDESLTELENKVLLKMNELAENICLKFAEKNETKVSFKNVNKHIKDIYNFLVMLPKERPKQESEDDAMLSKKPLGGFS